MSPATGDTSPLTPQAYKAHVVVLVSGVSIVVWLFDAGKGAAGSGPPPLSLAAPTAEALFTYHLLHRHGLHLLFDLIVILSAGSRLETRWGSLRFLGFYLAVAVVLGLVHLATGALAIGSGFFRDAPPVTYGSTGIAMAILVVIAGTAKPAEELVRGVRTRVLAWSGVFAGAGVLALVDAGPSREGESPFLIPQAAGVALGLAMLWLEPKLGRLAEHRRLLRIEREREREFEVRRRVDALLRKISAHGIESLTREEREFLERASRRFRSR